MPGYLPFAGRNAIAEMSVGIQFALPFDPSIGEKADAIKAAFGTDFPKFDPVQTVVLNIGIQSPMLPGGPQSNAGGFVLTKPKSDGNPARMIRIIGNTISVHIMEYTSWKEIKALALDYISRCLTQLGLIENNPVTVVLMRYVDRFTYDGDFKDASAGDLLQKNSEFVVSKIFGSGNQWHCNSGWYQPLIAESLALHNLNTSSVMLQNVSNVVIDHNSYYVLPTRCFSFDELMHGVQNRPPIGEILDRLHTTNVEVLKKLLVPKILATIGMEGAA